MVFRFAREEAVEIDFAAGLRAILVSQRVIADIALSLLVRSSFFAHLRPFASSGIWDRCGKPPKCAFAPAAPVHAKCNTCQREHPQKLILYSHLSWSASGLDLLSLIRCIYCIPLTSAGDTNFQWTQIEYAMMQSVLLFCVADCITCDCAAAVWINFQLGECGTWSTVWLLQSGIILTATDLHSAAILKSKLGSDLSVFFLIKLSFKDILNFK